MPVLIDTFNVLHTVGVLPPDLAGIDVPHLIALLLASRYRHEQIILACDGSPNTQDHPAPSSPVPSIVIRFSGAGRKADDLIDQIIRASTAPRRLTVISSDHAVQRAARRRQCKVFTSHEFLQQLVNDACGTKSTVSPSPVKPPPSSMSNEQIEKWIKAFNLDQATVEIPPGAAVEIEKPAPADAAQVPAFADDPPDTIPQLPSGAGLPPDLIQEAERLWLNSDDASDERESNDARKPGP